MYDLDSVLQHLLAGKMWSLCPQSSLLKGIFYTMVFIDNLVCMIQLRFWRIFSFQIGSYLKILGGEDSGLPQYYHPSPMRFYTFL